MTSNLLTMTEAAEYLSVSRSMFAHSWRAWGLPVVQLSPQTLRWRPCDLDAWTAKKARRMAA